MILVDTSVWIDYFNNIESQYTAALDAYLDQGVVAIGDIIYLEILQGIRKDSDYEKTRNYLSTFDSYNLLGTEQVHSSANYYRQLRKKGITVRSTTDIIIANFCITHSIPLLTRDRDFHPFVTHSSLKLANLDN